MKFKKQNGTAKMEVTADTGTKKNNRKRKSTEALREVKLKPKMKSVKEVKTKTKPKLIKEGQVKLKMKRVMEVKPEMIPKLTKDGQVKLKMKKVDQVKPKMKKNVHKLMKVEDVNAKIEKMEVSTPKLNKQQMRKSKMKKLEDVKPKVQKGEVSTLISKSMMRKLRRVKAAIFYTGRNKRNARFQSKPQLSIEYLKLWRDDRPAWKFSKLRENWLNEFMLNESLMSDEMFELYLEYMSDASKSAQQYIVKKSKDVINELEMNESELVLEDKKCIRAWKVIQSMDID